MLMMLGAGSNQLVAIRKLKEAGYKVLVSDYKEDSPGKKLGDAVCLADTFSCEATLEQAKSHGITGIMTSGTDQPVLTAALVAERLGLPSCIDSHTALLVTNKRYMKKRFLEAGIPTADYMEVGMDTEMCALKAFTYPAVLKPVDSQGQRGIHVVYGPEDIQAQLSDTLSYSRDSVALLESYYEHQEVTVSGWVRGGRTHILSITDRVTFDEHERIGVCVSHEFPTVHMERYGEELIRMTEEIVEAFSIHNGPIYFQFLIGARGILVNEIACRIGGAYEDLYIPYMSGVDLVHMQGSYVTGGVPDYTPLDKYSLSENKHCISIQLFFANPGVIDEVTPYHELKEMDCVLEWGCNMSVGQRIENIQDATMRAGFVIITGGSEEELEYNIDQVFDRLYIKDKLGNNLIIRGKRGNRS